MPEYSHNEVIDSPLSQRFSRDGKTVTIEIYRLPGTPWAVEVVDQFNNSTVWDEEFETDSAALAFVLSELERDGIDEFIGASSGE
jgi:hypothetical protein